MAVVVDQYRSDRRRSFRYSKQDHDDEPGESSSRDRGRPDPYMPDARRFVMVATTIQSQYEQDPAVAGVPLYSYVSIGLYTNDDYNPRCSWKSIDKPFSRDVLQGDRCGPRFFFVLRLSTIWGKFCAITILTEYN